MSRSSFHVLSVVAYSFASFSDSKVPNSFKCLQDLIVIQFVFGPIRICSGGSRPDHIIFCISIVTPECRSVLKVIGRSSFANCFQLIIIDRIRKRFRVFCLSHLPFYVLNEISRITLIEDFTFKSAKVYQLFYLFRRWSATILPVVLEHIFVFYGFACF